METEEYARIAAVEDDHWWYRNTRALVGEMLAPWLGRDQRTLDAGCGPGGNGAWLAAHGLGRAALRPVSGGVMAGTTLLHTGSGTRWIPLYGRRAGEDGGTVRLSLDDLAGGRIAAAALEHRTLVIGRGGWGGS